MRSNVKFMKEVTDAVASTENDTIIKFKAKRAGEASNILKKLLPSLNPRLYFFLRVIVVTLSTGEKEILLTSLLDKAKYPYAIFKDLYFKRWGVEVEYSFKKETMEIENFSGKSCVAVEQDFHAAIMVGNIQALLSYEAQSEVIKDIGRPKKYLYKTNRNVGIAILKDSLIEALMHPEICIKTYCDDLKQIMKRNLVPIRRGRSRPRKRRHLTHKYHISQR